MCGTAAAVAALRGVAEDLLVAGAEVVSLPGIEADQCALERALDEIDGVAVVVECAAGDEIASLDLATFVQQREGGHVFLHVDVNQTRPASVALQVAEAMMRIVARVEVIDIDGRADEASGESESESISGVVTPPAVPTRPAATSERVAPRQAPRRLAPFVVAGATLGSTAVVAAALALGPQARSSEPAGAVADDPTDVGSVPAPVDSLPARSHADSGRPAPPLPIPRRRVQPTLEVVAQGPTPGDAQPSVASTPSLNEAIARRHAIEASGVIAVLVEGERDWFHAMTTCKVRAMWGLSDWRSPSTRELLLLARTRAFGTAVAWSSKRGDSSASAVVMALDTGTIEKRDKTDVEPITICVRGAAKEP